VDTRDDAIVVPPCQVFVAELEPLEPLELLRDFVEELVFCDVNSSLSRRWNEIRVRGGFSR
jgi:hypothetical protein